MTPEERLAAAAWAATQEIAGSSAHRARLDEAVAVMAPGFVKIEAYKPDWMPELGPSDMEVDEATWNQLMQACKERDMASTVAPWGASADRRAAETVVLTGAKFRGPDLPIAAALASHRRAVMAAEADPFFGCTAGAPDWGGEGPSGKRPTFRDTARAIMAEQDALLDRALAEQCAILPERQVTGYTPGDYERSDALYPPTKGGWETNPALDEAIREMSDRHQRQQNERQAQQSDAFFNRQIAEHGDARRLREENARLRAELRTMRAVINAALGE